MDRTIQSCKEFLTPALDLWVALCASNRCHGYIEAGSMVTQHHTEGGGGGSFFLVPGNGHAIEIGSMEKQALQFGWVP
jgi:hypothetical protein